MIYVTVQAIPRIQRPKTGLSKGFPASEAKKHLAGRVQQVPPLIIIGNIAAVEVNAAPTWEYCFIASTAKKNGQPLAIQDAHPEENLPTLPWVSNRQCWKVLLAAASLSSAR